MTGVTVIEWTDLLNPIEVMQTHIDLQKKGIKNYSLSKGNDCIWVHFGNQNWYYIFRNGKIADIQID